MAEHSERSRTPSTAEGADPLSATVRPELPVLATGPGSTVGWQPEPSDVDLLEVAVDPTGAPDTYRVHVVHSSAGEAEATVTLAVTALLTQRVELQKELRDAVLSSGRAVPETGAAPDCAAALPRIGQELFSATLGAPQISDRYYSACAVADSRSRRLRVILRLGDPALAALPWEALYDVGRGEYVGRARDLVRHLPVAAALPPEPVDWPLRILGIVSAPESEEWLDVAQERRRLQDCLAEHIASGRVELTWASAATWSALQEHLLGNRWDILHFIGHGRYDAERGEGMLALVGRDGAADFVEGSRWVDLLAAARRRPRLVVLNSCDSATGGRHDLFSSTAAALLRGGVGAVVGMQFAVSDRVAIEFVDGLYQAVAHGLAVDEAVSNGRRAVIGLRNSPEWVSPLLYLRGRHANLFPRKGPAAAPPAPPAPAAAGDASPEGRTPRKWWKWAKWRLRWVAAACGAVLTIATGTMLLWPAPDPRPQVPAYVGLLAERHANTVVKLAYNHTGSVLATASADGTVRRWDTATGKLIGDPVKNPRGWMVAVAFGADDTILACTGDGGLVQLVDPQSGTTRQLLDAGTTSRINDVAFSPDGTLLASADESGTVRLWRSSTFGIRAFSAEPVRTFPAGLKAIGALAFTPDGTRLVTGSTDGTARVWQVSTGQQVGPPMTHPGTVDDVAVSPDGAMLATAGTDRTVRRWNLSTGSELGPALTGHGDAVWGVAFSPEGHLIASVSTGPAVRAAEQAARPVGGGTTTSSAGVRRSGATRSVSPEEQQRNLQLLREAIRSAEAEQRAQATRYYGGNGSILLWDAATGAEVASPATAGSPGWEAVAFHPDGRTLALAGFDGTVRVRPATPPAIGTNGAHLGINIAAVNVTRPDLKRGAVRIELVMLGSPARDAGLLEGDVILQVGTRIVENPAQLVKTVAEMEPGTRTTLLVLRSDELRTVPVTLTDRPTSEPPATTTR